MFIIVDGIDGSGKRTVINSMLKIMNMDTSKIFDIGKWSKEHHRLPCIDEIDNVEMVIGVEPSYCWGGAAIREEMIKNGSNYHPGDIAAAFAQDRLVIYNRCYLPILKAGKTIITERGVASSIVFQPAHDPSITHEEVLSLNGNNFAMQNPPDHLIIASLDPKIAIERLQKRSKNQDNHIFEKEAFMNILHERYHSQWFKKLFEEKGTKVHYLDTSGTFEEVNQKIKNLILNF